MPRRSDARKTAIQMLYLMDVNPDAPLQHIQQTIADDLEKSELIAFAEQLVSGVRDKLTEIDQLIEQVADNWRIERMAPTDRNVMRLAVFEMHHTPTPAAVAINEAIDLAREFGSENSAVFVNGILDRLTPENLANPQSTETGLPKTDSTDEDNGLTQTPGTGV